MHVGHVNAREAETCQAVFDAAANPWPRIIEVLHVRQHIDIGAEIPRRVGIGPQQTSNLGRYHHRLSRDAGEEGTETLLTAAIAVMRRGVEVSNTGIPR